MARTVRFLLCCATLLVLTAVPAVPAGAQAGADVSALAGNPALAVTVNVPAVLVSRGDTLIANVTINNTGDENLIVEVDHVQSATCDQVLIINAGLSQSFSCSLEVVDSGAITFNALGTAGGGLSTTATGTGQASLYPEITGEIWLDANGNGLRDASEIPRTTNVTLRDSGGAVVATVPTSGSGVYRFETVNPGTYAVEVAAPAGKIFTIGGGDSDVDPATGRASVTVAPSQVATVNAGVIGFARLGDQAWFDTNRDGNRDTNEPVAAGVTIELVNGAGAVVGSTQTGRDGRYAFDQLFPGAYSLRTAASFEWVPTAKHSGASSASDSDFDQSTRSTDAVMLRSDEVRTDFDLGLVEAADLRLTSFSKPEWRNTRFRTVYTVTNLSSRTAVGPTGIFGSFPDNSRFELWGGKGWKCTIKGNRFSCVTWNNLAPGQSSSVWLTVVPLTRAVPTPKAAIVLGSLPDPVGGNNLDIAAQSAAPAAGPPITPPPPATGPASATTPGSQPSPAAAATPAPSGRGATVGNAGASNAPALAFTGSHTGQMAFIGSLVLLLGAAFALGARRLTLRKATVES